MKILITGINGFAASHLARALIERGDEVHGTIRVRSDLHRIKDIESKITLHLVELTDSHSVYNIVEEIKPDQIYHLAAQSYVKSSWSSPNETMDINYNGTVNLLEAVRRIDEYKPSILVTSTSETYGHVKGWIDENTNQLPNTPYGISKLAQELIARCYQTAFDMNIAITRAFNITGPGRADVFVDSSFAKQIVEIEKRMQEPVIKHGNLESARDFINVEDVVDAYIRVLDNKKFGQIYCVSSGTPIKIQKLLDTLLSLSTVKNIKTEIDPERMRPVDTPTMQGNSNKIKKELGWEQKKSLAESCEDLLNYWREKL